MKHIAPAGRLLIARNARIGEAYLDALARAAAHLNRRPAGTSAPVAPAALAGAAEASYEDVLARVVARLAARPGTR